MPGDVAVVIPAKDEADRIEATVHAAGALDGVDVVVVVDDGSADGTGEVARKAGAYVVRHDRNRGKAAAMTSGADVVSVLDDRDQRETPRHLLFLDGDLGETAGTTGVLVTPVRGGVADMTIAIMPRVGNAGGHGFVVRLSREGIRRATGWTATQPLNGMRCISREAFDAARPLAPGWGVETALTIDLLRKGFRIVEVHTPIAHRVTGTDLRAQIHRGRQFIDVARALVTRDAGPAALGRVRGRLDSLRRPGGGRRP